MNAKTINTRAILGFSAALAASAARRKYGVRGRLRLVGGKLGTHGLSLSGHGCDVSRNPGRGSRWMGFARASGSGCLVLPVGSVIRGTGQNDYLWHNAPRLGPAIKAWRITWINPATNHREEQIGRRNGKDIGANRCALQRDPTRWRFTEITSDSFHWLGDALQPDGQTWQLEAEFRARRFPGKADKLKPRN
jgi:hypothetical protein